MKWVILPGSAAIVVVVVVEGAAVAVHADIEGAQVMVGGVTALALVLLHHDAAAFLLLFVRVATAAHHIADEMNLPMLMGMVSGTGTEAGARRWMRESYFENTQSCVSTLA